MKPMTTALAALVLLAGCGGNPFDGSGGTTPAPVTPPVTPPVVPPTDPSQASTHPELAKSLKAIAYNPSAQTLTVTLDGIDATPVAITFTRRPDLDRPGYEAYSWQETGLTRSHLAMVAIGSSQAVAAGVSDGGQFGIHFGGNNYARTAVIDTFTKPATGLFSYTGSYAGVFVPGSATTPGLPPAFQPTLPYRVVGDVLVNASFADSRVDGGITNRVIIDDTGATLLQLESVQMQATRIEDDGRFLGEAFIAGDLPGQNAQPARAGSYGGIFAGAGATDVAGAIVINPIRGENLIWEYGGFALPRCGEPGAGPLCALQ